MLRTGYCRAFGRGLDFHGLHGVGNGKVLGLGYRIIVGMTLAHSC